MIKVEFLGMADGIARQRVEGRLADGRRIDGILATVADGGDAWWEDGAATGGIEPGDGDGWDEIVAAVDADPAVQAAHADD